MQSAGRQCPICHGQGFYQIDKSTVAQCDHKGLKEKTATKGCGLDTRVVWEQTLEKLRGQLPKSTYATCKDTKLIGMHGNIAIIQVTSQSTVLEGVGPLVLGDT
jgi:hypothetical protein